MAENTKIEWADHTVNFWWGCAKISPACLHCYAERQDAHFHPGIPWKDRFQGEKAFASHWGPDAPRLVRLDAARKEALRYERQAVEGGRRLRVFANSMADFFEDRRDLDQARLEALEVIRLTPHLDWLILTKRPERILDLLKRAETAAPGSGQSDWFRNWLAGEAPANVWLGTTVEDQERADQRIPALLKVPAQVRFLSCEPLLGPVDLLRVLWPATGHHVDVLRFGYWDTAWGFVNHGDMWDMFGHPIHWVICGGESGPKARPMHPVWARGLQDQCAQAGVPFLFKQWGAWAPVDEPWKQNNPPLLRSGERWMNLSGGHGFHGEAVWRMRLMGSKAAGRLLDGREYLEYPEVPRA
jgi:protein gp37